MTESTTSAPGSSLAQRVARIEAQPLRELGDKSGLWAGTKSAIDDIWRRRELLRLLINRELKARYKDSNLGFIWSLFKPLSQLLIYFIVIGQFLGASRGIPYFAIFVFTGLTAWGFFLEAVTGGTGSIVANSGLVKKVYLPREIFPLSTLGTSAVNSAIQLVILLAAIVVTGQIPSLASLAYLPLALVVLVVYATLFGLLLSALNVYMRDIQHLIEVITFLAFWASPIVYSYSYVQRALATNYPVLHEVYLSNPVTLAILGFQRSLWAAGVDQPYPAHLMIRLAGAALIGIVLVFGAHRIFARLEGNFAQEL
ncbi:ABC transporter permease [Actinomyces bouchesdurhonensis]|uniref:Transport permease protein n=1 Tax=Actinomyces bouchesdurhonensis TaxID=1852361 RepID=A0A929WU28_9ACTO|nr:ABC transporter permease [Actinomyces bouchesdurhonensis]MBF0966295.1 ABC transporter permease [Actinomyces bouchesdurhonensis]